MNFIVTYFIVSAFFKSGKYERLDPKELNDVLSFVDLSPENMSKNCSIAINVSWFPEVEYYFFYCDENYHVKNIPDLGACTGFQCWESQITDVTRLDIVDILNKYRQRVAKGICVKWCEKNKRKLSFELRWDYKLEKKATEVLAKCPKKVFNTSKAEEYFPGLENAIEVLQDTATVSFFVDVGHQREMRLLLPQLLHLNGLNDWDENSQFRRGLTTDVGCAYVLRRKVDFDTSIDGPVQNANVGYLACVFTTFANTTFAPDLEPSTVNCKNALGVTSSFGYQNYYSKLCKVFVTLTKDFSRVPSHACQRGPFHKNDPTCDKSAEIFDLTWEEKFYGMILKLKNPDTLEVDAQCNIPLISPIEEVEDEFEVENLYHFNCTLKQFVRIVSVYQNCTDFNCEESNLRDVTKTDIINRLNAARHSIANGNCADTCPTCADCKQRQQYSNIVNVRWHWFLEYHASLVVKKCRLDDTVEEVNFEGGPFPDPVVYEQISLHFHLPPDGQYSLGETFLKLFWKNAFNDWEKGETFRRGNALFVGCALLVRSNKIITDVKPEWRLDNGIVAHMVCIYVGTGDSFKSEIGKADDTKLCPVCTPPITLTNPCLLKTVKNIPPFTNLCTSVLLEITMSCEINPCPSKGISKIWNIIFNSSILVQGIDGSFHLQKTGYGANKKNLLRKVLIIILLLLLLLLLPLLFIFLLYKKRRGKKIPPTTKQERPQPIPKTDEKLEPELTTQPTFTTTESTTQKEIQKTQKVTTQKPILSGVAAVGKQDMEELVERKIRPPIKKRVQISHKRRKSNATVKIKRKKRISSDVTESPKTSTTPNPLLWLFRSKKLLTKKPTKKS